MNGVDKTKVEMFSRGKIINKPVFRCGDRSLETIADSYVVLHVYLGILFNNNGKFTSAIEKQIGQAREAMFGHLAKAKRLTCL